MAAVKQNYPSIKSHREKVEIQHLDQQRDSLNRRDWRSFKASIRKLDSSLATESFVVVNE